MQKMKVTREGLFWIAKLFYMGQLFVQSGLTRREAVNNLFASIKGKENE